MADVELSSIKSLNLEHVKIIGHKNPVVKCRRGGGLEFTCHNCTIEGITWDGCGRTATKHPVVLFFNSSDIVIQNCSFQHSKGQAVLLSGVSGDVDIKDCKFVNNIHYQDEGAAIHYSSSATGILKIILTISDCDFSHNINGAASLVYIGKSNHLHNSILIKDSSFGNNKGNSIFVSEQSLCISGKVVFKRNKASNRAAGIFATNHSNVTFGKMSTVTFLENKFTGGRVAAGAISLSNYSNMYFEQDSVVTFHSNKARDGGAVHLNKNSSILFDDNSNVTFLRNSAINDGGAIYSYGSSKVVFRSISSVTFNDNSAKIGGSIFSDAGSKVIFEQHANVSFNRNVASENGGALVVHVNGAILFNGNTAITFANNQANIGAALRSNENCNITFTDNSTVTFTDNVEHKIM